MINIVYLFVVYQNAEFVYHTVSKLQETNVRVCGGRGREKFYIHVDSSKECFKILKITPM